MQCGDLRGSAEAAANGQSQLGNLITSTRTVLSHDFHFSPAVPSSMPMWVLSTTRTHLSCRGMGGSSSKIRRKSSMQRSLLLLFLVGSGAGVLAASPASLCARALFLCASPSRPRSPRRVSLACR
jgi:hypothetical protein